MKRRLAQLWSHRVAVIVALAFLLIPLSSPAQTSRPVPDHVPPKRSSQIRNGFGINSDLPRDPYLPWNRWWWTRMFDAGFKWARIGQYENSSDRTSWDWIEQKRGVFASSPELEDFVDSLVDNGVDIQVQLIYGNVMYTSPSVDDEQLDPSTFDGATEVSAGTSAISVGGDSSYPDIVS